MADTLILNWSRQGVVALSASTSGQSVRVRSAAEMAWSETATPQKSRKAAGESLKAFLRQAGMQADSALVCLPREQAVIHSLDVPRVPEEELAELVHLQAATKSSQPVEQLMIDFLPQPVRSDRELGSVLAATLSRPTGDAIRRTLEAADIELSGIGLSSVGLAEMSHAFHPVKSGQVLVAACLHESRLDITLARDNVIQMMQTSTLAEVNSEGVAAELRRIMFAAQQSMGEFTVGHSVLFVSPESMTSLTDLRSLAVDDLTIMTLADLPQVKLAEPLPKSLDSSRLVASLGLLLNRSQKTFPGIDFQHPRQKLIAKDDSRRKMAIYAAGALTLLSLGYYKFHTYSRSLDSQISQLQLDESTLKSGLAVGKPVLESDVQLQEWLARDVHMLQELDRIQRTLPGTQTTYLNDFQFDVALGKSLAKVRAEGQATNRNAVEEIYGDFNAAGFHVTPAAINSGRRDSEYPVEFELNLERTVAPQKTTNAPRS